MVPFLPDTPVGGVVVVRRLPPVFPEIGVDSDRPSGISEGTEGHGWGPKKPGLLLLGNRRMDKTEPRKVSDRVQTGQEM